VPQIHNPLLCIEKLFFMRKLLRSQEEKGGYNDLAPMRYDIHAVTAGRSVNIDWNAAERIARQQNGIAQVVGTVH